MDILIIEDERLSADRLVKLLGETAPEARIVATLGTVKETMEFFGSGNQVDLILSDISLPDGLCFSIFDSYPVGCPIIFITAYDKYALQAFEYNSIAYLMKPIRKEDLEKAMTKLRTRRLALTSEITGILKSITEGRARYRDRVLYESGEDTVPASVQDIAYFKSDLGATRVVMKDGTNGVCDPSLDSLEEQLDPEKFIRVSRQYIINIDDVKSIKRFDPKHSVIKLKSTQEEILSTNVRCNRLKLLLDK